VQARAKEHFLAFAERFAEAEDDGFFLRANGEDARPDDGHNQQAHREFDDEKTAAQRLGQRLRAGVLRFGSVGMWVVAHWKNWGNIEDPTMTQRTKFLGVER
jgi:hypothetical protein